LRTHTGLGQDGRRGVPPVPSGLRQAYLEAMFEDPGLGLEGFLRQAVAGMFGTPSREELLEFLAGVERDTVASIYTRAAANPGAAADAERLIEERREHFAVLAGRYAPPA